MEILPRYPDEAGVGAVLGGMVASVIGEGVPPAQVSSGSCSNAEGPAAMLVKGNIMGNKQNKAASP